MLIGLWNVTRTVFIGTVKIQARQCRCAPFAFRIPVGINLTASITDIVYKIIDMFYIAAIIIFLHEDLMFKTHHSIQTCILSTIPFRKEQAIGADKAFYQDIIVCGPVNNL